MLHLEKSYLYKSLEGRPAKIFQQYNAKISWSFPVLLRVLTIMVQWVGPPWNPPQIPILRHLIICTTASRYMHIIDLKTCLFHLQESLYVNKVEKQELYQKSVIFKVSVKHTGATMRIFSKKLGLFTSINTHES